MTTNTVEFCTRPSDHHHRRQRISHPTARHGSPTMRGFLGCRSPRWPDRCGLDTSHVFLSL